MEFIETTISEHIYNQGKAEGKVEGKAEGILEGQLAVLEILYQQGILSTEQMNAMSAPLRQKLNDLVRSRD